MSTLGVLTLQKVGQLGWAFVGEVASQRLRARTAGLAAAMSVVFGLTFNTAVPVMREYPPPLPSSLSWLYPHRGYTHPSSEGRGEKRNSRY